MTTLHIVEASLAVFFLGSTLVIWGFTPWYKTRAGWVLFLVLLNLLLILLSVILYALTGNGAAAHVSFSLSAINGFIIMVSMFRAQRKGVVRERQKVQYQRSEEA